MNRRSSARKLGHEMQIQGAPHTYLCHYTSLPQFRFLNAGKQRSRKCDPNRPHIEDVLTASQSHITAFSPWHHRSSPDSFVHVGLTPQKPPKRTPTLPPASDFLLQTRGDMAARSVPPGQREAGSWVQAVNLFPLFGALDLIELEVCEAKIVPLPASTPSIHFHPGLTFGCTTSCL